MCGDRSQRAVKISCQEQLARSHIAQPRKRRLQVASLDGRRLFADALESDQRRKQFIHVLWTTLRSALPDLANVSKMEPIVERELNERGCTFPTVVPSAAATEIMRTAPRSQRRRLRLQVNCARMKNLRGRSHAVIRSLRPTRPSAIARSRMIQPPVTLRESAAPNGAPTTTPVASEIVSPKVPP